MQTNLKIPSPWSQLALFLFCGGVAFIFTNIVGAGVLFAKAGTANVTAANASDPRFIGTFKLIQALSTVLLFGITAWVYSWRTFQDRPLFHLGFRPSVKRNFYLLGVLILLLSVPFEGWLGQLNRSIHLTDSMIRSEMEADKQIAAFLKANSFLDVVINVFIMALLPAIFEEACFRGALQRILIALFKNHWAGILVTAILFSSFHNQFLGFLPRFFLGALLGTVYWYSNSLWVPILAHFFTNGIQVVAAVYYPRLITENPSVPVFTALISLVIVVGLLAFMRKQSTVTYEQVYPA